MAWYPFGIYYPRKAVGLRGPPGIGFKLTNDGNYDMENKVLKNCHNPVDDQDVSTKRFVQIELERHYFGLKDIIEDNKSNFNDTFLNFVRETADKIKDLDSALRGEIAASVSKLDGRFLSYGERKFIDVKGKRIGNVADPTEGKNAVNKRYLENYVAENSLTMDDTKSIFNAKNLCIGSVHEPKDPQDVVTKTYMEKNALIAKNGIYDANNCKISNVMSPTLKTDVATKEYVDSSITHVTNALCYVSVLDYVTYKPSNFNRVNFTKFSGDLLTSDSKFSRKATLRISLFLDSNSSLTEPIDFRVGIKNIAYTYKAKVFSEVSWFINVEEGYALSLFVKSSVEFTIKTFLRLEEIKWSTVLQ